MLRYVRLVYVFYLLFIGLLICVLFSYVYIAYYLSIICLSVYLFIFRTFVLFI